MLVGDRNQRQKHMQRARIVLLSADRLPVAAVARQPGVSRPAVWRWQRRFAGHGVIHAAHRIELKGDSLRRRGAVKKPEPA